MYGWSWFHQIIFENETNLSGNTVTIESNLVIISSRQYFRRQCSDSSVKKVVKIRQKTVKRINRNQLAILVIIGA